MMPRSKKLPGSGDQGYFNEKRPVNVRVDGTAHLAELFPRPAGCWRIRSHHRGSVRVVGKPEVIQKRGCGKPQRGFGRIVGRSETLCRSLFTSCELYTSLLANW